MILRRVAICVLVSGAAAVGGTLLVSAVTRTLAEGVRTPDDAVTVAVSAVGIAVLAWYLLTALVAVACLLARAAGTAWVAGERRIQTSGAPLLRRLLLTGAAAVVATASVIAPATADPVEPDETAAADLGWASTDDEPQPSPTEPKTSTPVAEEKTSAPTQPPPSSSTDAPVDPPTVPTDPAPDPTQPEQDTPTDATATAEDSPDSVRPTDEGDPAPDPEPGSSHTVVTGESLWTIAAAALPADATDADIAAAWPDWYEANASRIGPDPDLIHPGQVLVAPDHDTQEDA